MKICQLSTFDLHGGAARAAYRLHQGLRSHHIDSVILVHYKSSADPEIINSTKSRKTVSGLARYYGREIDALPLNLYKSRSDDSTWSLNYLPNGIAHQVSAISPDIVHLNWVGYGFVPLQALDEFNRPLVWTLHDSWAFTGGCHLPADCVGYQTHCGHCPQLGSRRDHDLSRWVWNKKQHAWSSLNLTVVTPSRWLAEKARSSALFADRRIEVIPNGLDTAFFQPIDKLLPRRLLKLPSDKKLILFGAVNSANDRNKGFHLLQPALHHLSVKWKDEAELVIFGASEGPNSPNLGLKSHYLGYVSNDILLNLMYSAADVFVAPSMQENLPNTIMEALACGTPCVAFNIGGIPDLIDHQQNGYLAEPYVTEDLAKGIEWVLEDTERSQRLSDNGRRKVVREYELNMIAARYVQLYQELLDRTV